MTQKSVHDFEMRTITGEKKSLKEYQGKVLLVVNVASKCGLTPQYEGLQRLYQKYRDRGLEVLGFPANEFLAQEPGTNAEIQEFCQTQYNVEFPMFEKIVVKGQGQHPLYAHLTQSKPEARQVPGSQMEKKLAGIGQTRQKPSDILWNFEKFLIDRNGLVVERFAPDMTPEDSTLVQALESELARA